MLVPKKKKTCFTTIIPYMEDNLSSEIRLSRSQKKHTNTLNCAHRSHSLGCYCLAAPNEEMRSLKLPLH